MVYYCDICGNVIRGEPIIAKIEGATLILCEECSRKYLVSSKQSLKSIKVQQEIKRERVQAMQTLSIRVQEGARGTTFRIITRRQESKIKIRPEKFEVVENYSEIVRQARERLGLAREDLARMVGVKESIIRRIEEGQLMPDVELARKLEQVLRVKLLVPAESDLTPPLVQPSSQRYELTLGDIVEIRRKDEEST